MRKSRVVTSPRVEVDLRLELVRRARRSIDLITYDQRADPQVTLPLGTELRAAANRGVRVRFLVSWNSQALFDYHNKLGLLLVDPPALEAGSKASRLRLIGDRFPAGVAPADISLGSGVTIRRILSASSTEIIAEVDVAAGAPSGARDASFRSSTLERVLAIYDRIDYVKVTPESSLATFASQEYARGVQQFEAIGYQRGADGKPQTADDLALGRVAVTWSMEVFYETDASKQARVGTLSPSGFFTPASENPGTNFDVWIVATTTADLGQDGKPLVGKGYLVVTVPTYTFEGRTYVRELGRWVETGSSAR